MKSVTLLLTCVLLIRVNNTFNSEGISEAICHLSRFTYADIYKGDESTVQFSKILFKKCNMTVRNISGAEGIGHDIIGFVRFGKNDKVKLRTVPGNQEFIILRHSV